MTFSRAGKLIVLNCRRHRDRHKRQTGSRQRCCCDVNQCVTSRHVLQVSRCV